MNKDGKKAEMTVIPVPNTDYDRVKGRCQKHPEGGGCLNLALLRSKIPTPPKNGNNGLDPP